jgi:cytochrome b
VLAYLRGQAHPDHLIGHNPLGAASVFAMLAVLLAQVGSGLVSDDEIAFQGPLNRFVSSATGLTATWYHKQVGQWLLVGLVVLHIAAVLYYLLRKKQNLIRPMVVGDKLTGSAVAPSRDDGWSRLVALVVFGVCASAVYLLVRLGG